MNTQPANPWVLDDLRDDRVHARRNKDLGRLALLAYCEVKGWARQAGKAGIAEWATRMLTETPCLSKDEFLEKIDTLIAVLECHRPEYLPSSGVQRASLDTAASQRRVRKPTLRRQTAPAARAALRSVPFHGLSDHAAEAAQCPGWPAVARHVMLPRATLKSP